MHLGGTDLLLLLLLLLVLLLLLPGPQSGMSGHHKNNYLDLLTPIQMHCAVSDVVLQQETHI